MELFFRKYFWTVNLLFIFLFGIVAARTGNLFVESALAPTPTASSTKTSVRAKPLEVPASLNLERLAKLTGLRLPEPDSDVQEPQADMNSAPVKTSLRVKLLGTLLSGFPEWSIAAIQDTATQRNQTYMVGDKIQGAEILEIERLRVIIRNSNRREYISNEDGTQAPIAAYTPPPRPSTGSDVPPSTVLGQGIRSLGPDEYEVPRPEIDRTLSNLNDVAMQARIVPAFKDGVAQGFKLFSIRPDSIYTKIGIQNGDVIRRINGYDMNSPEKALEIYSKLRDASRIDIEVERNGTIINKKYNIR